MLGGSSPRRSPTTLRPADPLVNTRRLSGTGQVRNWTALGISHPQGWLTEQVEASTMVLVGDRGGLSYRRCRRLGQAGGTLARTAHRLAGPTEASAALFLLQRDDRPRHGSVRDSPGDGHRAGQALDPMPQQLESEVAVSTAVESFWIDPDAVVGDPQVDQTPRRRRVVDDVQVDGHLGCRRVLGDVHESLPGASVERCAEVVPDGREWFHVHRHLDPPTSERFG